MLLSLRLGRSKGLPSKGVQRQGTPGDGTPTRGFCSLVAIPLFSESYSGPSVSDLESTLSSASERVFRATVQGSRASAGSWLAVVETGVTD